MTFFFFQAEDGIRDKLVTGVQTCALPISRAKQAVGREAVHVCLEIPARDRSTDAQLPGFTWANCEPARRVTGFAERAKPERTDGRHVAAGLRHLVAGYRRIRLGETIR